MGGEGREGGTGPPAPKTGTRPGAGAEHGQRAGDPHTPHPRPMKQSSRAGLSLKSYPHMWPGLVLTLLAAFSFLLATFCLLLTASSQGSHPRGCSKALGAPREVAAGLVGPEPLGGDREKPHSTRSRAARGQILLRTAASSRTAPHGAGTASGPQCHLARHGRRRAASQRGCHFCGVSATNLGSLPLLWGLRHLFGVSAASLGSPPPLQGLCHLSRVSATSLGSPPPLRGVAVLRAAIKVVRQTFPSRSWQINAVGAQSTLRDALLCLLPCTSPLITTASARVPGGSALTTASSAAAACR